MDGGMGDRRRSVLRFAYAALVILRAGVADSLADTSEQAWRGALLEAHSVRIALESDPDLRARRIRREIRRLVQQANEALRGAATQTEKRERFNHFFFTDAGFGPAGLEDSAEPLLIHKVLQTRRGNCVGLAQAYLIIAQRLELPVVGVATPTHLLVRWVEGTELVNTELLEGGLQRSDVEYRRQHAIRETDPSTPIFLRDLGADEVAARIFNNRGVLRSRMGALEDAEADYRRAIELDPRFPAPRYNQALDLLNTGRAADALPYLEAALALHPADPWALNNRALVRMKLGRLQEALLDLQQALTIQPELPAARRNLELARAALARQKLISGTATQEEAATGGSGEPTGPQP
jgi:regulator of sirC expression with transglutaminase-like and TPR domain